MNDPNETSATAGADFEAWKQRADAAGSQVMRNSDELHQDLLAIAATPFGVRYLEQGVTSMPGQTFGLEMEFNGGNSSAVARGLQRLGLAQQSQIYGWHGGDGPKRSSWIMEHDESADGEVITPPLTDSPQTWTRIAQVCELIESTGGEVVKQRRVGMGYKPARPGGHVHVGINESGIKDEIPGVQKLTHLWAWAEDLMYRMGASSETYPMHRGMLDDYQFSGPLDQRAFEGLLRARSHHELSGGRGDGSRLAYHPHSRFGTVEFRVSDATLDPIQIQTNVLVCCALVHGAATLAQDQIPTTHHPLGTFDLKQDPDDRLLRTFADLLLTTPEQKLKLYAAYQRSRWQPDRQHARQRAEQWSREAPGRTLGGRSKGFAARLGFG